MRRPSATLRHLTGIVVIAMALTAASAPRPVPRTTLRVWKIGSPYDGDIPPATIPSVLREDLRNRNIDVELQTFPAKGFAQLFAEAVQRNAAPDILAFDNFGVIDGSVVAGQKFDGIGEDPLTRRDLVHVTGAYDDLLGPRRGWVYLFSSSSNHEAARAFALRTPPCAANPSARKLEGDFVELAPMLATAYLEGETAILQIHADPERMTRLPVIRKPAEVGAALVCGARGNSKLAFVRVLASYQGTDAIGRQVVTLVFRNVTGQWQLLVTSRDPITNGVFTKHLEAVNSRLLTNESPGSLPMAATSLQPRDGIFPGPANGLRFGVFKWQSSQSDDVVAEIGEFAYKDDARLVMAPPFRPGVMREISTGQLWTTKDWWSWRIWSISRSGDVAFSEVRSFYH